MARHVTQTATWPRASLKRQGHKARTARMACAALALALAAAPAPAALAQESMPKVTEPILAGFLVEENNTGAWHHVADYAQGENIPFSLNCALPDNLYQRVTFPLWLVAQPEDTLTYIEGSARVLLSHNDGTSQDITAHLKVAYENGELYAGSSDLKVAVPGLATTDTLTLYYEVRFNDKTRIGLAEGNYSIGHIEYQSIDDTTISLLTRPAPAAARTTAAARAAARTITPATLAATLPVLQAEASSAPLIMSADVTAVVYSYQLNLTKVKQGTDEPLAGAVFALRDANGLWYVRDGGWTASAEDATTVSTDERGRASFRAIDSEYYELVELEAPQGYESAGTIDVRLQTDVEEDNDLATTLSATSSLSRDVQAQAREGLVSLTIEDAPQGAATVKPNSRPDLPKTNANSATSTTEPTAATMPAPRAPSMLTAIGEGLSHVRAFFTSLFTSISSGGGRLSTTGDNSPTTLPLVLLFISVLALLGAAATRRSAGRRNTQRRRKS